MKNALLFLACLLVLPACAGGPEPLHLFNAAPNNAKSGNELLTMVDVSGGRANGSSVVGPLVLG